MTEWDQAGVAIAKLAHDIGAGRFRTPLTGWSAEMIAAHVAVNNEIFTELAVGLNVGRAVGYDNTQSANDEILKTFIGACGGLDGLVKRLTTSGDQLLQALAVLTPEQFNSELPVRIVHEGAVIADGWETFSILVDRHLTSHLEMHERQVAKLRLERYQCILLREGVSAALLDDATTGRLRTEHRDFLAQMALEGNIIVSGPLDDEDESALRGLMFYDVGSLDRARELANEDPAVLGGLFEVVATNFSVRTGDLVAGQWRT